MTRLYANYKKRIHFVSTFFILISIGILAKLFFIQSITADLHKMNTYKAGIVKKVEKEVDIFGKKLSVRNLKV